MPNLRRYATSLSTRWEVNGRNIANEWFCTTGVRISPPPVHRIHTRRVVKMYYIVVIFPGGGGELGAVLAREETSFEKLTYLSMREFHVLTDVNSAKA